MRKYKIGFDLWGLVLFLVIMIPNFIWFAVQAPYDVLRNDSLTPTIDIIASVCQFVMITTLLIAKRKNVKNQTFRSKWIFSCLTFVIIYFICWISYYQGYTNKLILLLMCLIPCLAFLTYEIDRKNWIALFPTLGFMVFHLIYWVFNFAI